MSAPVNANADSTASKQNLFCKSNNFNNIQLFSTPNDSKDDQKSHFTPPRLSNSKISKDCHATESLSNKTILKNAPTDISKSSIAFSTDYFPPDWIDSSYSPAYVSIQPGLPFKQECWNYTYVSVFLNELLYFHKFKQNKKKLFACKNESQENWKVFIDSEEELNVTVSLEWIKKAWFRFEDNVYSYKRKHLKFRPELKLQKETCFVWIISFPGPGTRALLKHSSLLFYSLFDFSDVLQSFVKKSIKNGLEENEDTSTLLEFFCSFCNKQVNEATNKDDLMNTIKGYLLLNIIPVENNRKNLPKIEYNGILHYITSGVYLLPSCASILNENKLNGFLLDTTFRVLPYFTTSIIMGSKYNTGFALGYSFGPTEKSDYYLLLLNAIEKKCSFGFQKAIIELDQGKALRSAINLFKMTHLVCLRHLLKNLHFSPYSFHAKQLIEASTKVDYDSAVKNISQIFYKAIDRERNCQNKKKPPRSIEGEIKKVLDKIGLFYSFELNKIDIKDQKRWEELSLQFRPKLKMPSTTNSLESYHGHLNKLTPRRNNFYSALCRLSCNLMNHNKNYSKRIKHNYEYLKRSINKEFKATNEQRMISEMEFYETTDSECQCSSTKLASAQLELNIPCKHQLALKRTLEFPELPDYKINMNDQYDELIISYNPIKDDLNNVQYDEKKYVIDTIKFYSKYKGNEIESFVDSKYNLTQNEKEFVLNKPATLLHLIDDGICNGCVLKSKKKEPQNK